MQLDFIYSWNTEIIVSRHVSFVDAAWETDCLPPCAASPTQHDLRLSRCGGERLWILHKISSKIEVTVPTHECPEHHLFSSNPQYNYSLKKKTISRLWKLQFSLELPPIILYFYYYWGKNKLKINLNIMSNQVTLL